MASADKTVTQPNDSSADDGGLERRAPAAPAGADGDALPLVAVPSAYYRIEGEEGRGGIGVVLRALDRRLGRTVALKQLQATSTLSLERFEREMRITARLQHPGVVPVHEAGCFENGVPFYAMKLIEGRSLRERLGAAASLEERLALLPQLLAVTETMAYAHSRGVIHRDLKPANVVIADYGEAIVIDWGLAKEIAAREPATGAAAPDDEGGLTVVGEVVGTPAYMPPEQARGEEVDARADVWALGAILYYMVAGVPPYQGASTAEILARVLRELPTPLARLQADVPPELCAIVARAMARVREDRYPSAAELAADLRRFVAGQLVSAHRYSAAMLLRRWARRHRGALAVAAVALAALALVGGLSLSQVLEARRVAERRTDRLTLAEASRSLAEDPAHAIELLASYPDRGADWSRVEDLALVAARAGLPRAIATAEGSTAVGLSEGGERYAILDRRSLRVLDARTGRVVQTSPIASATDSEAAKLDWLSDGSVLAAREDGVWILEPDGRLTTLSPGHGGVQDVASDAGATQVAVACQDGSVWLWDRQRREGRVLARHERRALAVAFAGARVLSVGADGKLRSADPASGATSELVIAHGALTALAVSQRGSSAAVGGEDGDVWIVELATGTVTPRRRLVRSEVGRLAFVADDASLLSLTWSGQLVEHELTSADATVLLTDASTLALSPGRVWLAIGRQGGHVVLQHLASRWQREIPAHPGAIAWAAIGDEGETVTTGADGSARLWPASLVPARILTAPGDVRSVSWQPGQAGMLVATGEGQLALVDREGHTVASARPQAGAAIARFGNPAMPVLSVSASGTVVVLDATLQELGRVDLHRPILDFRLQGEHLALGHPGGTLTLLDRALVPTSVPVFAPDREARRPTWLDDAHLVVASDRGELARVDVRSGTVTPLPTLPAVPTAMASFADGRLLVLSDDGSVRTRAPEAAHALDLLRCADKHRRLVQAREPGSFAWACGKSVRLLGADGPGPVAPALPDDVLTMDLGQRAHRLVAALRGGWVALWDSGSGARIVLPTGVRVVDAQLASERGDWLAVALADTHVLLWRVDDDALVPTDPARLAAWLRAARTRFGASAEVARLSQ